MAASRGVLGLPPDDDDPGMQSICLAQGMLRHNLLKAWQPQAKKDFKERMNKITTQKRLKTHESSFKDCDTTLSPHSAQPVLVIEQTDRPLAFVTGPVAGRLST